MIQAKIKNVVLDEKALHALIASPSGPVAKELGRIGARIEGEAKQLSSGELVRVRTGRYRSAWAWKLFTRGDSIGVAVGNGVHYSVFLERGTRFMAPRRVLATAAQRVFGRPVR